MVSVAWLLGFYVLAAAVIAAVVIGNVVFIATTHRAIGAILVPSVAVVIAIIKGTLFVERRTGADSVNGFEVDERTQPELTTMVRSVAAEMGTEPPSRIFLVPDVNAYVLQSGSFLGIVPGERVMAIGLGIMNSLTVDQLRAVVAHELGHYAGGDTRLGPLSYRAGATIYRTVEHLGPESMIGKVFQAYGRRYLMLSLRVRRRQELSADAAAVRLAGRENHVAALRRVAAAAPAWSCFVEWYVLPLWQRGGEPENLFDGYRAMLADPGRQEELARLDTTLDTIETHPFDSHPSLVERVTQARALPEGDPPGDDRPAGVLLRDAGSVEWEVSRIFTVEAIGRPMERRMAWDTAAREVFGADLAVDGNHLLQAAGAVGSMTGGPGSASLATAVDLVADGRDDELVDALVGDLDGVAPDDRPKFRRAGLVHGLGAAIGSYLAEERDHAWRMSWAGAPVLVDAKGRVVDPFELAEGLVDEPSAGPALIRHLGGRARLGKRTVEAPAGAGQAVPYIVGVLPHVTMARKAYDLVATRTQLIFHPSPRTPGLRWRHALVSAQLAGPYRRALARRIEALVNKGAEALTTPGPGTVVIARENVEGVKTSGLSGTVKLTVRGQRVDLKVVSLDDKAALQQLLAA